MKATNQDGANCTVNGVDFKLEYINGECWLVSKYEQTPIKTDGIKIVLQDAPYELINVFGDDAYEMVKCALNAM